MTVVDSKKLPANLFVRGTEVAGKVAEIRPQTFQLAQFVQAVVVEKGQDAVLEILNQRYLAQGEQELQPGQKLLLQVLQTQPQLEFKVVDGAADSSLERLLPLLTRSYDWTQLASVLDDSPEQAPHVKAMVALFAHLQNVSSSENEFSSALRDKVAVFFAQPRSERGASRSCSAGRAAGGLSSGRRSRRFPPSSAIAQYVPGSARGIGQAGAGRGRLAHPDANSFNSVAAGISLP